ncbi:BspA family leucine-rich repeat surface protein [Mycoplasma yeatsii]|uniref:BspA family leucine-rich repeat surface protein n=1 Tax=Mycoplasma yeatsii TaxID=51365 RepID=UPI0005B24285|nr:BspA family leucine-rich repeat surface protein [Mycoplasma yeatsii]AJM71667.1 PARCEL domain-containing protein [Mycoplasma yeatsii GM274B]
MQKKVETKKKSKSKILLIIAGLLVIFGSITGVTVGLLHSKKEQNKDFIDLSRDISEKERFLDILYIENKEEILKHINKILIPKKSNIDIKPEHVTMVFNKNSASATVIANNSDDVKGEVELKFYKPDIAFLVKNEDKDLGLFIVVNEQNIIDEIIRRNILQNNKFDQNFNFEKFNKDFDININQQSRTIVVKAKSDSTHYTGEVEFKYQSPFSSLDQVITTLDRLENNSNDTILNRFLELNRNLFNQENVKINKDQLKVEVNQNTAKIILTGNKNYQGEIEVNLEFKTDISNLDLNTNAGPFNSNDSNTIIEKFIKDNEQKLPGFTVASFDVVSNRNGKLKIKVKDSNNSFQGTVEISYSVKTDIASLELNTNAGIFDSVEKNAIIDSFIANNREKLQGLTTQDFEFVGDIQDTSLTVKVKDNNPKFKGQIVITFSIKDDFNKIGDIVKEINNLNNNDQETVLNRFYELNQQVLRPLNITKDNLKVEVTNNTATITIENHPNYQGSINVNLRLLPITFTYLGVLDNDDQRSVLDALNKLNKSNLSLNDLNIEIRENTATITGRENKKSIGTINVEFGLKAIYSPDDNQLTRIGFFKNERGKWQIERVDPFAKKVPPNLPTFISSLHRAFNENRNTTISGLENWDTSNVTDMSFMFSHAINFNQSIGNWNTSNVTNMEYMFNFARNFNQPLGDKFDTSKVTNMVNMFNHAENFNQPLGDKFNTKNVTSMNFMFNHAYNFNQPLGDKFDTSKVTNMSTMFRDARSFNQSLGDKFDTSKVTNMNEMFRNANNFNQPLGDKFDTSKVTNMNEMFRNANNFNQSLGDKFDTSNVIDMRGMFYSTTKFNQPLGDKFDTSKVTNMVAMFQFAESFNQSLGDKFYTSNVTDMGIMFQGARSFNQPLGDKFDTSNVTDMGFMFYNAESFNQDISNWNVTITDPVLLENFMVRSKLESMRDKLPAAIRKLLNL